MDLTTSYMGIALKNPLVASASPLTGTLDGIKRLEDGGVAAVVMASLFEEQIRHEHDAYAHLVDMGSHSYAESLSYFPKVQAYHLGTENHLNVLRRAAESVKIPIIASINCVNAEGWMDYAKQMQQAGASGLELNLYSVVADLDTVGADMEQRYLEIVTSVKANVGIPIALKLSPFFSAMGSMAKRLDQVGTDGLVLFNRFYQPDIDITTLEVASVLQLSSPSEIRLPLLWIALLYGNIKASLAATSGVETGDEVIKYILAGADVVMSTSALLRHGPAYASTLLKGLAVWMEARGFQNLAQMRGNMSHNQANNPAAFERANYLRMLESYQNPYQDS